VIVIFSGTKGNPGDCRVNDEREVETVVTQNTDRYSISREHKSPSRDVVNASVVAEIVEK
jgi:hypothetical protein